VEPSAGPVTLSPPPRRRRVRAPDGVARVRAVEVLLGLLAVLVATWAFDRFYAGLQWLPYVGGAVVLGGAAVVVGLLLRWRWWWTAALTAVLLLLLAHAGGYSASSWYGLPTPDSLRAFGDGLTGGLPAMLSIGLPADATCELLVVPVLLAGIAGAATVALVLRTRRVTVLVLSALLLFAAGLALSAARGGPGVVVSGVLAVILLGLLLVRSNRLSAAGDDGITATDADAVGLDLAGRRGRALRGRLVLGLPAVVMLAVLAVVAGWFLPIADGSDRADPRALYSPPFQLSRTLSPLGQVRPQLTGPDEPLFRVQVRGDTGRPLERVRIAALDTFDGALWTRGGDFSRTGSTLPDPEPLAGDPEEITLHVEVERLRQPFLPVTGEPVRFAGTDFAFDRSTGTVVSTGDDLSGLEYTTTGQAVPLDDELLGAAPSDTFADAAWARLPDDPPDWVGTVAERWTEGRETPMAQLMAIEAGLLSLPYSREAPPAHSYGALYQALFVPGGEHVGGVEQFASAFAVLARSLGFPARVAVGYRLLPEARDGDGFQVSTHDAFAWPEVHLAGRGWVLFSPANMAGEVNSVPPRDPDVTLGSTTQDPGDEGALESTGPGAGGGGLRELATRSAVVAVGVLAGVGLVLMAVVLAKVLRRRWRSRHGSPAERVVAAWREVTDRLREAGVRVPVSSTGREVATGLRGGPAAPVTRHVTELAPLVAGALFAIEPPDEVSARRAWELERHIRRELRVALPVATRLRGVLDPRPLLPRHRRRVRRSKVSASGSRRPRARAADRG
jgi:hypothetical protein